MLSPKDKVFSLKMTLSVLFLNIPQLIKYPILLKAFGNRKRLSNCGIRKVMSLSQNSQQRPF
jgi:hypothetical protein